MAKSTFDKAYHFDTKEEAINWINEFIAGLHKYATAKGWGQIFYEIRKVNNRNTYVIALYNDNGFIYLNFLKKEIVELNQFSTGVITC